MTTSRKAYSKSEENKILKIPFMKGKGPHTQQLHDLAKSLNRSYGTVWQKWFSLHGKGVTAVKKDKIANITPMTFKAIDFEASGRRINEIEEMAMRKGLDDAIENELKNNRRAILFPTRLVNRASTYLKKSHSVHRFRFYTHKKDRKMKELVMIS
jgi:hypothetical protein